MADRWESIGIASGSSAVNLRRADPDHPLDWFRGRDSEGRYLFVFEATVRPERQVKLPHPAGIDVSLQEPRSGSWWLMLRLLDSTQVDIFGALCANLLEATQSLNQRQEETAIEVILTRIQRWQELLRRGRNNLLSLEQRIGLFGELLVMRDVLLDMADLGSVEAVAAWRGPEQDEQDFLIRDRAIEVKTQLSTRDRKMWITSADQLDPSSVEIFLCHQALGVSEERDRAARTLSSLVNELRTFIEDRDSSAYDLFAARLIQYGYIDHADYGTEHWALNDRTFFEVLGDFPCIQPGNIPAGVGDVRYSISVDSCRPFTVQIADVIDRITCRDD